MLGDVTNMFCELSETQSYLVDSVRVGKQTLKVKKIMYFTEAWVDRNWFRPIKVMLVPSSEAVFSCYTFGNYHPCMQIGNNFTLKSVCVCVCVCVVSVLSHYS